MINFSKTVKHKALFLRMQVKETPPMRTLFVTSVSVHYSKLIYFASDLEIILWKLINRFTKLIGKKPMNFFFSPMFVDSAKTKQLFFWKYQLPFQLRNIYDIYDTFINIYNIFITYLL